jgi:large conductance mechanosensitive channel
MLKGFKEFALKGDLITAAVGLVMALATFALISAVVEGLITPIIAAVIGEPRFASLAFTVNGSEFAYGAVLNALIVFVATAAAVYFFVVVPYAAYQRARGISPATRPCPECTTAIPVAAKRCPSCTASLVPESA